MATLTVKDVRAKLEKHEAVCAERWKDVDTRVVEHNIRVIAKCYSKIRSARLAMLLDKSQDETEENLSKLVVAKSVSPPGQPLFPTDGVASPRFLPRSTGPTGWSASGPRQTPTGSSTTGRPILARCSRWLSAAAI